MGESVRIRHVILGTLPCVSITSLNQDANMATNADPDTMRLKGSPAKKSEKSCVKVQLPCSRSLHNWIVCLKILIRENLFYGKKENWDQIAPSNSPRARWHHLKTFGKEKGPSRGVVQKSEPHERNPCAPKFEEGSQDETVHQGRCARRVAWDLAKNVYKLKNTGKASFYFPV